MKNCTCKLIQVRPPMLDTVLGFLTKLLDQVKYLAAALFVRRATQIEVNRDELAATADIQKEQLDIAAAPDDAAADIRKQLRDGKL